MTLIYFIYGLAFFSLGLAVALESRHASKLPLSGQLPWLAAFALLHSCVEWIDMFRLGDIGNQTEMILSTGRTILLPLSALLLVRFGIGLMNEAGPLPDWLTFVPVVLLIPAGLLVSYGMIVALTEPPLSVAADIWSRYLLYFPGSLFAATGFIRQARLLNKARLGEARGALWGAGIALIFNALVAGLFVSPASYGLAPWINSDLIASVTTIPVQIWRALSAVAVAYFVIRAMGVFEAERKQQLASLNEARAKAQEMALQAQSTARQSAEDWTGALVGISRQIAGMENVDDVLLSIVSIARRLLNSDTAILALWDESETSLEMKCCATTAGAKMLTSQQVQNEQILKIARIGSAKYLPENGASQQAQWICPVLEQRVQAAAIVPLRFEGHSAGSLWVNRIAAQPFSHQDVRDLERLADQAVIAITHALMAAREQSLAVVEERGRIAREMHDGLAQILGYLSLEMQTLEVLNSQGNQEAVLAELQQARERINAAQADVRENILSLRTTLSGNAGLTTALQEYVDEFSIQTGIKAEFICHAPEPLLLSPLAETQMVRIVQEALSNVRKHACANRVILQLARRNGYLSVSVIDDGMGFEMPAGRGHFGLSTMHERAESAGGGLKVSSHSGEGTRVEFWLPVLKK